MKSPRKISLLLSLCLIISCAPAPPAQEHGDATGTWVGDFGPAFYDRNTISLELSWDGHNLTGMIRPGVRGGRMYRNFEGIPIENAAFDPGTGAVKFEATYRPKSRHYVIEGKIVNNTLSGSWNWDHLDETRDGDFKLTRK